MTAQENYLFVCSMGRHRSKTGAHVFGGKYCGTDQDADVRATPELMEWADHIVCMENRHRDKLRRKAKGHSHKMFVLGIPDEYVFLAPELVHLISMGLSVRGGVWVSSRNP